MRTHAMIHRLVFPCIFLLLAGCLSVRAPERIEIGSSRSRAYRGDSSKAPATRDHAHAREELKRAYSRIAKLEERVSELKDEIDDLEEELEDARDKHDD